ncbi:transmembrane protein 272-like isoform X2 [Ptychodera flava]
MGVDLETDDELPDYEYIRANPPSYESSLIARIKAAKHQAKSTKEFLDSLCGILCASAVTFIGVSIVVGLPFVLITVGSLYVNRCPAEPYIPIYLVVFGAVLLVTIVLVIVYSVLSKRERAKGDIVAHKGAPTNEGNCPINCLMCVIMLMVSFLVTWQFAAYVWVFRIHEPNFTEPDSPDFCFQPIYYLAFWMNIASFVIYATSLCVGCTICCCVSISR